jgi:aminopeptidase N
MTQMPVVERDKGVQTLEALARSHPQYVVRLGAYRGLMALVPSQPDLKNVLFDIKSKETDERLKNYYNLM